MLDPLSHFGAVINPPLSPGFALLVFSTLEPCFQCFGRLIMAGVDQVVYLQRDPDMADIGFTMSKVAFQQLELKAHPVPGVFPNCLLAKDIEILFQAECRSTEHLKVPDVKVPEFLCWDVCHNVFESGKIDATKLKVTYLFALCPIHVSFFLLASSTHGLFTFCFQESVAADAPDEAGAAPDGGDAAPDWGDAAPDGAGPGKFSKACSSASKFLKNSASLGRNMHTK